MVDLNILRGAVKLRDVLFIIMGVCLMSVGVRVIYEPLNLVTGGVSGFAIIVKRITGSLVNGGIPIGLTTALVNIPLFIAGWFIKGKQFIIRSAFATILFSLLISVIPEVNVAEEDYFLAALWGGVLTGTGLGLVVMSSSSTGGTELISAIIRYYYPHISIAKIIFTVDSLLVISGAAIFGVSNAAYAVAAAFVTSRVMDAVISGPDNSKMLMVITERGEEISERIFQAVERGVTSVDVTGMYSGGQKKMLICAVSRKQSVQALRIIRETDSHSFVMITDSREIFGEGFVRDDEFYN